jgi:hypothetical protein
MGMAPIQAIFTVLAHVPVARGARDDDSLPRKESHFLRDLARILSARGPIAE